MPRFIAIEWDSREARVAIASTRGNERLVEEAFSVPLGAREEAKSGVDPQVGDRIAAALNERGIKRSEALVSIGRGSVELKQLTLPPVPDAELPQMVRLQATREFHSLAEDWPLDYVPLTSAEGEQRTVLAAAMSPELMGQIQQTCQTAGVKPLRVVLRPVSAASLFLRRPEATEQKVRLLIDVSADEADLCVLVDRDVVFLRTARLPNEGYTPEERARQLQAEVRRTLAAAHNQLGARRVEAIYFCSTQTEHEAHASRMEQDLGLPVRLFNPFSGMTLDRSLRTLPEAGGRFAALLGLLCDQLDEVPPGLDFLNPHKPPAPPSRRKQYLSYGVIAAAAVAVVAFVIKYRLGVMDQEISDLAKKSAAMDPAVKRLPELEKSVGELQKWATSDICWLDELRELSDEMPPSKDAMLTGLRLYPHSKGGEISLDGQLKQPSVIDVVSKNLRDEHHAVESIGGQQDTQNKNNYGWQWKWSVLVKPQSKDDYQARAKKKTEVAARPAVKTESTP